MLHVAFLCILKDWQVSKKRKQAGKASVAFVLVDFVFWRWHFAVFHGGGLYRVVDKYIVCILHETRCLSLIPVTR